ncbi:heterokaryon incompatibility protein [Colletotrichum graminicola M1.001]|uniref:Heterokaryon incompatibility protein n=1 Tax=Colletotrichum graminicola (strain M1.001 / M2 / FGSC 10212) TaxID=645133 RepID=E3QTU9_COLGM|nr:heterokaryon incompatibility protein [Colletotrichum graminicola M1.001]EFQ34261.1 heterokaryon incompatibility protein [Colletotrichum graminicola M1.001]
MASVPTWPSRQNSVPRFSYDQVCLPSASTHIRVLELYPSRHATSVNSASPDEVDPPDEDGPGCAARYSSPLRCAVSTTPIDTPRPYKALSYTWGKPDKSHGIDIGGARLGITASLDTALRHVRKENEPVTLWIDQICINQADAEEKNEQVPLMAQIYSRAELVLVWLGPAADGSDALMECWEDIGQAARDLDIESYLNRERLPLLRPILENRNPEDPATVRFQALVKRAVPAFNSLLEAMIAWNERPWFGRVWTIQEQALGTNTFFLCGYKMLNLDLLPLATLIFDGCVMNTQDIKNPGDQEHIKLLAKAQDRRFGPLMAVRRRRRNFVKGEGPGDDLYHMLKKAYVDGDAQATLPRDRIYGLLSVAVDAEGLQIVPEYTSPHCHPTFVKAARALVGAGRVEMLSFSQFPKDVDGLPSWVPDWRPTLTHSYLAAFEDADRLLVRAAGDSTVEVAHTDDPCVLGIRGLAVDTIEETGDVWEWEAGSEARASHLRTIRAFCDKSSACGHDIYESSERRAEAAWRVPVGDLYWTSAASYHRVARAERGDYEACLAVLALMAEGFQSVPPELRQQRLEEFYRMIPAQSNYSENMDKMTGKRPYVTRLGYVGMAPGGAHPGDVVVVLLGSRIPYVLRPSSDGTSSRFVGEAYCDGVMDGEMLTKRPHETFLIA